MRRTRTGHPDWVASRDDLTMMGSRAIKLKRFPDPETGDYSVFRFPESDSIR